MRLSDSPVASGPSFAWPRQHGVVTRDQLESLGLGGDAIDYRIRLGRLRRLHRGVYLVGPVAPPRAREMAAVLACGEDAVLSHGDAARLSQLLPYPAQPGPVHVTIPGRAVAQRSGICVHRTHALAADECTILDRIPVTTPARTILDLAANVDTIELEQALAAALRRRVVTRRRLQALLARHPRRAGSAAMRALLDPSVLPAFTRSRAEQRLLSLVRTAGLLPPEANVVLEGYEVDFLWRQQRVVVEVDGFEFHSQRDDFERDRARDAHLAAA